MTQFKTFYVVNGDGLISRMMGNLGYKEETSAFTSDIVMFSGGADVDPSLYGEKRHPRTHSDIKRDWYESDVYHSLGRRVLKVGICRGGQFLNVMNGGKMYQDSDHPGRHPVGVSMGGGKLRVIPEVNSTHHQIMKPMQDYELWGYCNVATYKDGFYDRKDPPVDDDAEIVFYPKTNTLCFQPHPEYGHVPTFELFKVCLDAAKERVSP